LGAGVAYEYSRFFVGFDAQFGLLKVMDLGNDSPKNLNFTVGVGYKF